MIVLSSDLMQKADRYIDENHETFAELGKRFFDKFRYDKKNNRINTQIRNFQQMACSATRFADIEDYVKNQMGKERTNEQTEARWKEIGVDVLQGLKKLREESQNLDDDAVNQMALRLRLARGWGRAVVGEYLYQVALDQMGATP